MPPSTPNNVLIMSLAIHVFDPLPALPARPRPVCSDVHTTDVRSLVVNRSVGRRTNKTCFAVAVGHLAQSAERGIPYPSCGCQLRSGQSRQEIFVDIHPDKLSCGKHNFARRRNEKAGGTGYPRGNPPTNGIVRHDSNLRKSGSDPAGDSTRFALVRGERANRPAPWPHHKINVRVSKLPRVCRQRAERETRRESRPQNRRASRGAAALPHPPRLESFFATSRGEIGATVAERLARSPPTKAIRVQCPAGSPDIRKWELCRTIRRMFQLPPPERSVRILGELSGSASCARGVIHCRLNTLIREPQAVGRRVIGGKTAQHARQYNALRVEAMRTLMCMARSPLALPRFNLPATLIMCIACQFSIAVLKASSRRLKPRVNGTLVELVCCILLTLLPGVTS
ncbi:hypothetical protein PR048_003996 [Dryococelus australis]|uniref:Uncharacterized protein n=1 Tax=Dryococelus australis TaxID=614101 RepID=A0ABQ9I490_9NEOP|nr:hypothetical protein PR048_003996 [Dryococelus australis]